MRSVVQPLACRDRVLRSEDLEFGGPRWWGDKFDFRAPHDYEALHEAVDTLYLPTVLAECKSISVAVRRLGITRDRLRIGIRRGRRTTWPLVYRCFKGWGRSDTHQVCGSVFAWPQGFASPWQVPPCGRPGPLGAGV
jgi:hypothetical protein